MKKEFFPKAFGFLYFFFFLVPNKTLNEYAI
jgi:hypothetical protein